MSRLKTPVYFAFLTLLSFAFIHPLAAQSAPQAWSITGQVTDSSGRVVPGATIVATNRATGLDRLTVSDADGTFVVSNLSGQTYRVVASLSGFAAATADVTAASGRLTLVLTPATHVERVTVVSGSRAEERRATLDSRVDVISRARLDSTARASVGEVLREVPGVVSRRGSIELTAQVGIFEVGREWMVGERRRGLREIGGRPAFGDLERGAERAAAIGEGRGIGGAGQKQQAAGKEQSHAPQSRT